MKNVLITKIQMKVTQVLKYNKEVKTKTKKPISLEILKGVLQFVILLLQQLPHCCVYIYSLNVE